MKTAEELQLELLEQQEENKKLLEQINEKNERISGLEKTNTKLYDRVTSIYGGNEETEEEEKPQQSFEDFTKTILGGK